jgi:hypothetical protein
MDTALIVVGLILVGAIIIWMFTRMSDPKQVDEEEEAQVRRETPGARERETFDEAAKNAGSNKDDIAFYSPGESGDE